MKISLLLADFSLLSPQYLLNLSPKQLHQLPIDITLCVISIFCGRLVAI
jgi:hypothetical protein